MPIHLVKGRGGKALSFKLGYPCYHDQAHSFKTDLHGKSNHNKNLSGARVLRKIALIRWIKRLMLSFQQSL